MAKIQVEINGQLHDVKKTQLFDYAKNGVINPETRLVYNDKEMKARNVHGIEFLTEASSEEEDSIALGVLNEFVPHKSIEVPMQKENAPVRLEAEPPFCTFCGESVKGTDTICLSCGTNPLEHRKYCRFCGTPLTPEQIICVKCKEKPKKIIDPSKQRSQIFAFLLTLFLGGFGFHKFYFGSWGWGMIYLVLGVITSGGATIIFAFISFFESIDILRMSKETFWKRYDPEERHPFRW